MVRNPGWRVIVRAWVLPTCGLPHFSHVCLTVWRIWHQQLTVSRPQVSSQERRFRWSQAGNLSRRLRPTQTGLPSPHPTLRLRGCVAAATTYILRTRWSPCSRRGLHQMHPVSNIGIRLAYTGMARRTLRRVIVRAWVLPPNGLHRLSRLCRTVRSMRSAQPKEARTPGWSPGP